MGEGGRRRTGAWPIGDVEKIDKSMAYGRREEERQGCGL